ncbi:MAG TPA: DUF3293 domain-containing protein, partial [Xanthomonadales bacterium]|nr:DUF3293 domain-containing protein [Xanthomonadales bacterium]
MRVFASALRASKRCARDFADASRASAAGSPSNVTIQRARAPSAALAAAAASARNAPASREIDRFICLPTPGNVGTLSRRTSTGLESRHAAAHVASMPRPDAATLLRAYIGAVYTVSEAHGDRTFRIGDALPFVVPAAYITAWNPHSRDGSRADNDRANESLATQLRERGATLLPARTARSTGPKIGSSLRANDSDFASSRGGASTGSMGGGGREKAGSW